MTRRNEFSPKTKAAVRERSGGICEMEGCENEATEIDHVIECWEGGDNSPENAMDLCTECHRAKSSHSTHLRCKGKRFAIVKGRPKSGKIQSRSSWQSRPFPKPTTPSVLSRGNKFYRKQKFS